MAIKLTYFDFAYFDVDYFNQRYIIDYDDPFPTDSATDFHNILLEIGDLYHIIRQTTTTDALGQVSDISETDSVSNDMKVVFAHIQDITKKDRQIHNMGLAVSGNSKIFFKENYFLCPEFKIEEGDIIYNQHSETYWRLIKIIGERKVTNTIVFKVGVVQSIDDKGSRGAS
jgi:hypothetical protein